MFFDHNKSDKNYPHTNENESFFFKKSKKFRKPDRFLLKHGINVVHKN